MKLKSFALTVLYLLICESLICHAANAIHEFMAGWYAADGSTLADDALRLPASMSVPLALVGLALVRVRK